MLFWSLLVLNIQISEKVIAASARCLAVARVFGHNAALVGECARACRARVSLLRHDDGFVRPARILLCLRKKSHSLFSWALWLKKLFSSYLKMEKVYNNKCGIRLTSLLLPTTATGSTDWSDSRKLSRDICYILEEFCKGHILLLIFRPYSHAQKCFKKFLSEMVRNWIKILFWIFRPFTL